MATSETLERKIQSRITQRLKADGWMVVKIGLCSMPGFPDLMALKDGVARFIEVKQPGKTPRPLQKFRHQQLRNIGFEVEVLTE